MIILGINAYHGDASACILKDGQIISACEEERFNRIKHSAGFPKMAIQSCLSESGLNINDIDYAAISRDPKANFVQKIVYTLQQGSVLSKLIKSRISNASKIFSVKEEIERALEMARPLRAKIVPVEHHLAHMASSFFASSFDQAAILSIDGFGDFVSTKWGLGTGNNISVLGQVDFPHSMGILYTAITQYLGFQNYGDEYKVMGLAAMGEPVYKDAFYNVIKPHSEKGFHLNLDYFVHHKEGVEMSWEQGYPHLSSCFSPKLAELLGPARNPKDALTERHRNIAASLQNAYEEIFFQLLNMLHKKTGLDKLCLAGGCALNAVANGKIRERTPFKEIFVQPAAGDAGTALGAALYVEHAMLNQPRSFRMTHAYLGPEFHNEEIQRALESQQIKHILLSESELIEKASKALQQGKIVGWFQGKMEFGPRALGNRSLLADPRRKDMKDILNRRIKHREDFRPFAPSILEEETGNFFESSGPVPFMTQIFKIKPDKRELIPAVTHVDGTGRLQTVSRQTNPKYWALIRKFADETKVPVVLNTSFNENEPIVCTPRDAVNCFQRADVDCLAIGNYWIER